MEEERQFEGVGIEGIESHCRCGVDMDLCLTGEYGYMRWPRNMTDGDIALGN